MSTITFSGDLTETVTYRTVEETIVLQELRCHDCGTEYTVVTLDEATRWAEGHVCPRCAVCTKILTEDGELCGAPSCKHTAKRRELGDE